MARTLGGTLLLIHVAYHCYGNNLELCVSLFAVPYLSGEQADWLSTLFDVGGIIGMCGAQISHSCVCVCVWCVGGWVHVCVRACVIIHRDVSTDVRRDHCWYRLRPFGCQSSHLCCNAAPRCTVREFVPIVY